MNTLIVRSEIFQEALLYLRSNKLRSFLTMLGIIFGVAAVISMMAIGNGTRQETLAQLEEAGANNLIILPAGNQSRSTDGSNETGLAKSRSTSLSLRDYDMLKSILPNIRNISVESSLDSKVYYKHNDAEVNLCGITNEYFAMFNRKLIAGAWFSEEHEKFGRPVCVVGHSFKQKLFHNTDPVGKSVKINGVWLTIIGVLAPSAGPAGNEENRELITTYDNSIFTPVKTMLLRFKNYGGNSRTQATPGNNSNHNGEDNAGSIASELDKIIVQIDNSEAMHETYALIHRILYRAHHQINDYRIVIPEELIRQQQRSKYVFKVVLITIAVISLLVGGIGIMNIMFASVLERMSEIGVKMALGARRIDIINQFLVESTIISLTGGLIGIILGIAMSELFSFIFDINILLTIPSFLLAFFVSISIGILFGFAPAQKASKIEPVKLLRHE